MTVLSFFLPRVMNGLPVHLNATVLDHRLSLTPTGEAGTGDDF